MSEDVPLPQKQAALDWGHISIQIDFHPPIKITRKIGLEFAAKITDCLEPEDVQLDGAEWRIFGGGPCEGMELRVSKRSIYIHAADPQNKLEWYEERFHTLLGDFYDSFIPHVALRTRIILTALLGLPDCDDVLPFLGGWVLGVHPYKFDALGRPLNILGVRLALPPTQEDETQAAIDWGVDVRVETFGGDSSKLFLEADAEWSEVEPWDKEFVAKVTTARIPTVSTFLQERVITFLRQPPVPDEEEGNDDDERKDPETKD